MSATFEATFDASVGLAVLLDSGFDDGVALEVDSTALIGLVVSATVGVALERHFCASVSLVVGVDVGAAVGAVLGAEVGVDVGVAEGVDVGVAVGVDVGVTIGVDVGLAFGAARAGRLGRFVGLPDGFDIFIPFDFASLK